MLDAARSAIREHHLDLAFRELDRHSNTFPSGQLVEERKALRILALARAGRHAEADEEVSQFRSLFPDSVFAGTIDPALAPSRE